jgi:putative transposase
MLGHMIEKVEEGDIFCRERTPTAVRVFGALTYHAGASYRKAAALFGVSHEALRQWYLQLEPLFQPPRRERPVVAVDETKVNVDGRYVYCWVAVDVQTFEIVHPDVTPGRSSLDALLFLKPVLERCRGKPLLLVDRGPWYDWSLETLGCRFQKETWGTRSLIESLFFVVKYRLWRFWKRFPYRSSVESTRRWCRAFAAIHNVEVLS